MEQLLQITSVPLKYELNITPARLEYTSQKSQVDINKTNGGFQMKSRAAKLLINTRDARNSICPTPLVSTQQTARKGIQAAQDATAQYAMEGRQLLDAKLGEDVLGRIFSQRAAKPTGEFQLGFLPSVGPEIQFVEPDLQMQYQTDKLQFDIRVSKGDIEFIPGKVNVEITQWPDVVIEYIGKPIYVPPRTADRFEARA